MLVHPGPVEDEFKGLRRCVKGWQAGYGRADSGPVEVWVRGRASASEANIGLRSETKEVDGRRRASRTTGATEA